MAMQLDFALRPSPPALPPMALEPMEMIMCDASPPNGLWLVPLPELQPDPISTSRTSPYPLSLWIARHLRPSAVREKVTFPITPFSLGSPSPFVTVGSAAAAAGRRVVLALRSTPMDGAEPPAPIEAGAGEPASPAGATGPAVEPPVDAAVCVCEAAVGAGVVPVPVGVVLTVVAPDVVGVVVLGAVCLTAVFPAVALVGACCWAMDWSTARLGFDPPLPTEGAVVVVVALTVVVVVAAAGAVVGGVAGTVVAGATVVALAAP